MLYFRINENISAIFNGNLLTNKKYFLIKLYNIWQKEIIEDL